MKLARPKRGMPWSWLRQATGVVPSGAEMPRLQACLRRLGRHRRAAASGGGTERVAAQGGFTLLELLVVISIMALATAGVSMAIRDNGQTVLEREAARLAALLESGRAQSRSTGGPVRWRATEQGFKFEGLPASALPSQWLDPGVTVRGTAVLLLGPEPLIGPQQVVITHQNYPDRALRVVTDGLRPFTVESLP
ncbi:general secretion pathway protein H [Acidovorax sp. 56]|nr:general secretion pathway protein H [Acidovorax sp. 56]